MIAYACGSQDTGAAKNADSAKGATTVPAPAPVAPAVKDVTENPDYLAGLELLPKSDCLSCHKVEEKVVGPAYREVANKYSADDQTKTMLAEKVIKGGSGVWGTVPMPPHPTITPEDAKTMVGYILSLKQKCRTLLRYHQIFKVENLSSPIQGFL